MTVFSYRWHGKVAQKIIKHKIGIFTEAGFFLSTPVLNISENKFGFPYLVATRH
jgi:hypothetical protein